MRMGILADTKTVGAYYRAQLPADAMRRRGHELIDVPPNGRPNPRLLMQCDAVLIYRVYDPATCALALRLRHGGVRVVYDNDDDYSSFERHHRYYQELRKGGKGGAFAHVVRIAKAANLMTTTTNALATRHRKAGVERVEVIPNLLAPNSLQGTRDHEGIVVGYIGGQEHRKDVEEVPVRPALLRLLDEVPALRVECIGVDLKLPTDRYRHIHEVPFDALRNYMAGWDVAIAPLVDSRFNRARSDIKVKEYAACHVPWVASKVGPYADLGEAQGGLAVRDDEWYDALRGLIADDTRRRRLVWAGAAWARASTIDVGAGQWERALFGREGAAPSVSGPRFGPSERLTVRTSDLSRFMR